MSIPGIGILERFCTNFNMGLNLRAICTMRQDSIVWVAENFAIIFPISYVFPDARVNKFEGSVIKL